MHLAQCAHRVGEVLEDLVRACTTSKVLSSYGNSSASATWKAVVVSPRSAAAARARSSGGSTFSIPTTRPGATTSARSRVMVPGPHPTSSTLIPGRSTGSR
jgi:hypothetical protein